MILLFKYSARFQIFKYLVPSLVFIDDKVPLVQSPGQPFYAPALKDWGHIVLPLSVCPSVLSVCLHKLNIKTNLVTRLIFGMKAHLIDTHLLVPRSRSSAKVEVKYQGHVSQKMGVSGA